MIQLVVCDMAGTTVLDDDAVLNSFRAALAAVGVDAPTRSVNDVMGLPKPQAIRMLLAEAGKTVSDEGVAAIHGDFVARMLDFYRTGPTVREVPGASETFDLLRAQGIKVALNTGFSRDIVDVIVARLGWSPRIDATIASDEVAQGRPFPDMIRRLMIAVGVTDPSAVAKIGDTPVDLDEGNRAGCGLVLGVTTGTFSREELEAHRNDGILDSIADLPARLLAK